jgi:hypothetical protein
MSGEDVRQPRRLKIPCLVYLVIASFPRLGEGVIDDVTKGGMRDIMEKSSDLFFNRGTNSSHEYKCTDRMFEPCDSRCQAQESSDSILADALQSLHLRALKKLYENWLIDQFLSVYFISDQDAMILDKLVCLEDAGTGRRWHLCWTNIY